MNMATIFPIIMTMQYMPFTFLSPSISMGMTKFSPANRSIIDLDVPLRKAKHLVGTNPLIKRFVIQNNSNFPFE